MNILENRREPVPAKQPLLSITIILTRDEVSYIQDCATLSRDKMLGIRGSSTVVELVERIQEVEL